MKAVIDRVSHQVAKKACLSVVENTRSKRREAALLKLAKVMLPWVRNHISERRRKAKRFLEVYSLNRRVAVQRAKEESARVR